MTPDEIRAYVAERKTAILVSNGPDGFPHPMPMWFGVDEDGSIRMATYNKSQKVRNIERDPRVSILFEDGEEYDKLRGLVYYGRAELIHDLELAIDTLLEGGGAPEEVRRNPDARKATEGRASKRVVIRLKPERIVSWDHAKLGGTY